MRSIPSLSSFALKSAIYLLAVVPKPAAPNVISIPKVERTIPNSPNLTSPNILAQAILATNTIALPKATPVNDQNVPFAMREETDSLLVKKSLMLLIFSFMEEVSD